MHDDTPPAPPGPPQHHHSAWRVPGRTVPARVRAGLVVPPEHLPLLAAGVDVRPRYRVTDPDTGELVERTPRVRRVPAVTGSTRVYSLRMVDRHSRTVDRQIPAAAEHGRAPEYIAALDQWLEQERPAGARRVDARRNILMVYGVIASCADFRSARGSRPGRTIIAAKCGLSERTVTRICTFLAGHGWLRLDEPGRHLSAAERAAIEADPEQRNRWRDRATWSLLLHGSMRQAIDVEVAPRLDRGRAVLALLADPDVPAGLPPVVRSYGSVAPPIGGSLVVFLPLRRTKFSQQAAAQRRRRHHRGRPMSRPDGRARIGAASRPSPTKGHTRSSVLGRQRGVGRPMPPEAVALARQLATDRRFPWLADAPPFMLAATVQRFAQQGWTVSDVHEQIEASGWSFPEVIEKPLRFLKARLDGADPARPPATSRHQAEQARREQQRAHQAQQRAERARRANQAVPAPAGYRQAREQLDRGWPAVTQPPRPATSVGSPPASRPVVPEQLASARLSGRSSAAIRVAALDRARREKRERLRGSPRPGGVG